MPCLGMSPLLTLEHVLNVPSNQPNWAGNMDVKFFFFYFLPSHYGGYETSSFLNKLRHFNEIMTPLPQVGIAGPVRLIATIISIAA